MGRRTATAVRVSSPDGVSVVLPAGADVPEWALKQITNEAALLPSDASEDATVTVEVESEVEGEGGAAFEDEAEQVKQDGQEVAPVDYESMRVAELRALAESRGLPTDGVKADIVSALQAADQA